MSVNEKMTALADAIRSKTGGTEKLSLDDMAEAVQGLNADSYYDTFWDAYQQNGNRTDYSYAFGGLGWAQGGILNPKYPIRVSYASRMFEGTYLTDLSNLNMDFSICTSFTMTFANSMIQKIGVIDTRSAANLIYMLSSATRVVTVEKVILREDGSQSLGTSVFNAMSSLQNIVFEGVIGDSVGFAQSNQLSNASVQSIIDHLKDGAGKVLTLHATVKAKLTDDQIDEITDKNWTLA